ncbi:aldo/keto reductase [Natrialba sp. INN-245]|uniref:aldo/keto reductase n=1 Tax=Natrialba sp. INN-245 TaxID=2690967 RepID=UPI00130F8650|nr:aldo/keto reductase [Natrialba sp. INN-245]MWV41970.1 aldo/keto reductase [Natrialba sp. INN-245]
MESRRLTDGYTIEPIITGAWQLAEDHSDNRTNTPVEDLFTFVDAGFSTFDCADHYTGVEELLGTFREQYRDETGSYPGINVHTKFVPDKSKLDSITPEYVERIIDRSRRRLNVDSLDLVQFHWWDYEIDNYVKTMEILHDLKKDGKIDHLGVTNFDVRHLEELIDAGIPVISNQVQYSLLDDRPERELVDFCEEHDIKLLCYGTLAGGFLTERYLGEPEPEHPMENRSLTKYKLIIEENGSWSDFQMLLEELSTIADKHEVSIANVASRYILQRPRVCSAIVGARNTNHIDDNLRTTEFKLDSQDMKRIERALDEFDGVPGGVYIAEREDPKHANIMKYNSNT